MLSWTTGGTAFGRLRNHLMNSPFQGPVGRPRGAWPRSAGMTWGKGGKERAPRPRLFSQHKGSGVGHPRDHGWHGRHGSTIRSRLFTEDSGQRSDNWSSVLWPSPPDLSDFRLPTSDF